MTKPKQPSMLSKKPTHRIYLVTGEGESAFWTAIGAAWPHKDGLGFSINCDALPLTGRLVMRVIDDESKPD